MTREANERSSSESPRTGLGRKRQFPCPQCGASLSFEPGETLLLCPYCGHKAEIVAAQDAVEEIDFHAFLAEAESTQVAEEVVVVRCGSCGAELDLAPDVTADECPFCGDPIVATRESRRRIRPRSLLPFRIGRSDAVGRWRRWIESRWFAPNALRKRARQNEKLQGVYVPYWTYDSRTESDYDGQRGDDYWTTETYSTIENGKSVMKTRQVRRTRWRSVSGRVRNVFDDVLVLATSSLPQALVAKLEPWDLEELVPYADDYLSGFRSESYRVGLAEGFEVAKTVMDEGIRQSICRDIGGDHQRIHNVHTLYSNITFKHLLLPVWVSAYRFHDKIYRFVVNARTGEVQGERPWSFVKIALAVLAVLAVAGTIAAIVAANS